MSETKDNENKSPPPEQEEEGRERRTSEGGAPPSSPDIHFDPIVELPLVQVHTLEENEEELIKLRAKLYRYDTNETPPEFKERGTGDVKILKHKTSGAIRILMRRDKTLKLCANHYILPSMQLKKHNNSEKVFVWSTLADLSDEEPKHETLAIRFGSIENAQKFKDAFEEAKKCVKLGLEESLLSQLNQVNLNESNEDEEDEGDSEDDNKKEDVTTNDEKTADDKNNAANDNKDNASV